MKNTMTAVFSLFVMLGVVFSSSAFADHPTADVSVPAGTSVPGCEETNACFLPYEVTVDVGGEVTWTNDDSAAHTVTSGTPAEGPDTLFDSGLFMAGQTFSVKFGGYEPGQYNYFCMVHPWMEGIVAVQTVESDEVEETHDEVERTLVKGISSDGSIEVRISSDDPVANERLALDVEFYDASNGELQGHMNYNLIATQDGGVVLSDENAHAMSGTLEHLTGPLNSNNPVDIEVTILGIGQEEPYTGPSGDVITFQVVPEFGTIAMMILGVAVISIIILNAKSKLSLRI